MTTHLQVGDCFADFELPNHQNEWMRLSQFTQPSLMDRKLGFLDRYPLILVFYRGFFCPRDRQQFRHLVQFQDELAVNYCQLATVSIEQINILDETEGEYANRAQPYTFVLRPDLSIYKIYNGWFFVGRPTIEELRLDLRAIMETRSDYRYDAYNTQAVKQIRIPQTEWLHGLPPLGANGLPVMHGVVRWFDLRTGNGAIATDNDSEDIFFNFTAIPGEGYRTLEPGTPVKFELVENQTGLTARNIQKDN